MMGASTPSWLILSVVSLSSGLTEPTALSEQTDMFWRRLIEDFSFFLCSCASHHHRSPHRRPRSHIICLTKFPHTKWRKMVWNKQNAADEINYLWCSVFGKWTCCAVLSIWTIMDTCVTTFWLLLQFLVLGWKNLEIGTLRWWAKLKRNSKARDKRSPMVRKKMSLCFSLHRAVGLTGHKKWFKKIPKSTVAAKINCSLLSCAAEGGNS